MLNYLLRMYIFNIRHYTHWVLALMKPSLTSGGFLIYMIMGAMELQAKINILEMQYEHEHQWGEVENAFITGNPHRKCQVPGCKSITLDLIDDEDI